MIRYGIRSGWTATVRRRPQGWVIGGLRDVPAVPNIRLVPARSGVVGLQSSCLSQTAENLREDASRAAIRAEDPRPMKDDQSQQSLVSPDVETTAVENEGLTENAEGSVTETAEVSENAPAGHAPFPPGTDAECLQAAEEAREARAALGDVKLVGTLYSGVVTLAAEKGAPDVALQFLREMQEAGGELEPDSVRHSKTIQVLYRYSREEEVREVYRYMVTKGLTAETHVLHKIFSIMVQDQDYWLETIHLFETLRVRQSEPGYNEERIGLDHYRIVTDAALRGGFWTPELINMMQADGVEPSAEFLKNILSCAIRHREFFLAELWFRRFTEAYRKAKMVKYESMLDYIKALVRQFKMTEVNTAIRDVAWRDKATKPLEVHALECFCKITLVTPAALLLTFLPRLAGKHTKLHPDTYSKAIAFAAKEGDALAARQIFKQALDNGVAPNPAAIHWMMFTRKGFEGAQKFEAFMRERSMDRSTNTFAAMLHACSNGEHGDIEKATECWTEIEKLGLDYDERTLVPYIKCLMKGRKWEEALDLRETARNLENESEIRLDLGFLTTPTRSGRGRTGPIIDTAVCEGLLKNSQWTETIAHASRAIEAMPDKETAERYKASDARRLTLDDYNDIVKASILACRKSREWEPAARCLEAVEKQWAKGPWVKGGNEEWLLVNKATRQSRRNLYDGLIAQMVHARAPHSKIRAVLERGLRNGSVLLLRDGASKYGELVLEFNKCWSPAGATVVLRCILEDILVDKDFFLENGQYKLYTHVEEQLLEEFGNTCTWYQEGPKQTAARQAIARMELDQGPTPVRSGQYEQADVELREAYKRRGEVFVPMAREPLIPSQSHNWHRRTPERSRLTISLGRSQDKKVKGHDWALRQALNYFAQEKLDPPLRIAVDSRNKFKCFMLRGPDVLEWAKSDPVFKDD